MDIQTVKKLLKSHNIKPSKRLGQNFLINEMSLQKIISASSLAKKDVVLEIGPGTGTLTFPLAKIAEKVVAVEKDIHLYSLLDLIIKEKEISNIKLINKDILKMTGEELKKRTGKKYKIIANIPYYLTSFLIRKFLELKHKPEIIILTIQKEVAQRICVEPPKMNLLSVAVQFYAEPKIISYISKNSFWPKPKIDSAILRITPKKGLGNENSNKFFEIVKAGFAHPRKQIINNLSKKLEIKKEKLEEKLLGIGISPSQRAESLSLDDWQRLAKDIK